MNLEPWHGQAPLAATSHPMCVQIAVWQTTVPPEEARMTGPDGALALIDPAASTSATEANGVPVGAASDAAVVGSAAAVVGSAAVGAAAAEVDAFADAAADVAAAELVADVVVVGVVLELQAAAAASTAVPEAAKTVRRGRLRDAGVTAGVLQVGSAGAASRRE